MTTPLYVFHVGEAGCDDPQRTSVQEIYRPLRSADDPINFAQGEMAMFSTYLSRQVTNWRVDY